MFSFEIQAFSISKILLKQMARNCRGFFEDNNESLVADLDLSLQDFKPKCCSNSKDVPLARGPSPRKRVTMRLVPVVGSVPRLAVGLRRFLLGCACPTDSDISAASFQLFSVLHHGSCIIGERRTIESNQRLNAELRLLEPSATSHQ